MIPKAEFLEWIDGYCLDALSEIEKVEFEKELENNVELKEELILQQEIFSAITETDVIKLKEKLETAANIYSSNETEASFEILDDFADIKELADSVSNEDLINFYDSLPKAHIHQHDLVSNENITEFYKEQNQTESEDSEHLNGFDMEELEEFEGLEEAILEKDILNLRDKLSQVAKSLKPQYASKDIDKYLNNELSGEELELFENELDQNRSLKEEVELHKEMEMAVQESDILSLRDELSNIMETETSWQVSADNIDAFMEGVLEGDELLELKNELARNTDLMAEVKFQKELAEAVTEKEIFELKDKLEAAQKDVAKTQQKTFIPQTNSKLVSQMKHIAAIAVIVLTVGTVLSYILKPVSSSYDNFYMEYKGAAERSISFESDQFLNQANYYFLNGDRSEALSVLEKAEQSVKEPFVYNFHAASILQLDKNYAKAITEYNKVLKHGDNYFIEEAEWNKSLCLVQLGEKEMAKEELQAVINRNGYYKKDAKAILRKIKYSVK